MTDRAIVRLAEIARDYDQAGKPHYADIIEDAMMRLSQSAVGNWWNGVKQMGQGLEDTAKSVGNAIAAPFEAIGGAADSAWNNGIKNVPQGASQNWQQGLARSEQYQNQATQSLGQGLAAAAGPGGTGLEGAVVQDAAHGVGQALQGAAQGYVNNAVTQQQQAQQTANMATWMQQAIQAHKTNGTGWQVINNAVQYGQLTPENQATMKQQFNAAASQIAPGQH